jgi:hypothetical protein
MIHLDFQFVSCNALSSGLLERSVRMGRRRSPVVLRPAQGRSGDEHASENAALACECATIRSVAIALGAEQHARTHAALRRTLRDGRDGNRFIINIPGRGYCFVMPIRQRRAA